jgi:hypothetical protein
LQHYILPFHSANFISATIGGGARMKDEKKSRNLMGTYCKKDFLFVYWIRNDEHLPFGNVKCKM